MDRKQTIVLTAALAAAAAAPVLAQCDQQWVFDSAPEPLENFGASVAITGDVAFVGAPKRDVNGKTDSGAMFMYFRNGDAWTPGPMYAPNSNGAEDWFGASVAADGNWALVGAPNADTAEGTNSGRAVFYTNTSGLWLPSSIVLPTDVGSYDFFGAQVALNGNTAVIGAYGVTATDGDPWGGAIMIFDRSSGSWLQETGLLTGGATASNDKFGTSLAVHDPAGNSVGLVAMGGAARDRNGYVDSGEVRLFKQYTAGDGTPNWAYTVTLGLPAGHEQDNANYGASIAVRADGNGSGVLVVGAPSLDIDNANQGRVYVYRQSGGLWTLWGWIDGPQFYGAFGKEVSLRGESLLISGAGAVRRYRIDTTAPTFADGVRLVRKLTPEGQINNFGISIAQTDTDVIAGDSSFYIDGSQCGGAVFGSLEGDEFADRCEHAEELSLVDPERAGCYGGFGNEGAPTSGCGGSSLHADAWFRVAPNASTPAGRYRVVATDHDFPAQLSAYDDCMADGGVQTACGVGAVEFMLGSDPVLVRLATNFNSSGFVRVTLEALPNCPADLDGDGSVGFGDLLTVLQYWNVAGGDIDGDGVTGFADLTQVLANWGPCP